MQMLMNEDFVEKLKAAKTPAEFLDCIDAQEEAQFGAESFTQQEIPQSGYRILAVTACVNGIAHTYICLLYTSSREDVDNCKALRILAESDVAGPFLMSTENGRQIFVTGHPEYDKYTLDSEYRRDVDKGLPIHVPVNYYPDDDPSKPPLFRWRAHAHLLYENWLNYYVYQNTPYDLGEIQRVKHE